LAAPTITLTSVSLEIITFDVETIATTSDIATVTLLASTVTLLAVTVTVTTPTSPTSNPQCAISLTNPSFELNNPAPWISELFNYDGPVTGGESAGVGFPSDGLVNPKDGTKYTILVFRQTSVNPDQQLGFRQDIDFPVECIGQTYAFSFWYNAINPQPPSIPSCTVGIYYDSSSGSPVYTTIITATPSPHWTQQGGSFTLDTDESTNGIFGFFINCDGDVNFYVDNFNLFLI
jgi:hypothetical protein